MALRVGFVGLGNMGYGMARNLAQGLSAHAGSQLQLLDTDAARALQLKDDIAAGGNALDVRMADGLAELRGNTETVGVS